MNASPPPLIPPKLAHLPISSIRFAIPGSGRLRPPAAPDVKYVTAGGSSGSLPGFSVAKVFDVFALRPLAGAYTLHLGTGMLCYDPTVRGRLRKNPGRNRIKSRF